jgi:DNA-binding HxlR family transcriptional regulator
MREFNKSIRGVQAMRVFVQIGKPVASHLLLYLLAKMDKSNSVHASRGELMEGTGLSKNTLTSAMRELKDLDLVRKRYGSTYLVNPDYAHFGDSRSYHIISYEWGKAKVDIRKECRVRSGALH